MTTEAMKKAIDAYFNSLNNMNAEAWIENFAQDSVIYDPVGNPPNQAHENYQKFFGMLHAVFEKVDVSQDYAVISGKGAAVKWTMQVLAKNGKTGKSEGITTFEFNDEGKFQQASAYWSDADLMNQVRG